MIREIASLASFEQEVQDQKGKVVLYGASSLGRWVYTHFDQIFDTLNRKENFYGFCDKQAAWLRNTERLKDYRLLTPEECARLDHVFLFICTGMDETQATTVHTSIVESLSHLGLTAVALNYNQVVVSDTKSGMVRIGNFSYVIDNFAWLRQTYGVETDRQFNALLDEYSEGVHPVVKQNQYCLLDYAGTFFNIVNGKRITTPFVEQKKSCIHMFGDSRILSVFTGDSDTISSRLQSLLPKHNRTEYQVINYGMQFRSLERMEHQIKTTSFEKGDWVILGSNWCYYQTKEELIYSANCIRNLMIVCQSQGLFFLFLELPSVYEITHKTEREYWLEEHNFFAHDREDSLRKKIFFDHLLTFFGIDRIDMSEAFDRKQRTEDVFIDLHHYNPYGNQLIAEKLCEAVAFRIDMQCHINSPDFVAYSENKKQTFRKELQLQNHHQEIANFTNMLRDTYHEKCKGKICGAIVMNCNPFTKGHLYLVEKAASTVDVLFIFVLEEDKSYFSFADRFDMVQNNTRHLENVIVLKSGNFIISSLTFPEYFEKEHLQGAEIDASQDIITFAQEIAPSLTITKRFVGEEPNDAVTNQYNVQLKEMLPHYGIELIEIPRHQTDGTVVSASLVRKEWQARNYEAIRKLVPEYTYEYLLRMNRK